MTDNELQWLARRADKRVGLVGKTVPIVKDREHPFWGEPASEETGEDGHPFWGEPEGEEVEKGQTYLKPGEEAPEGTEEQEGPRGGKYYETKPAAEKPAAERDRYIPGKGRVPSRTKLSAKGLEHEAEWADHDAKMLDRGKYPDRELATKVRRIAALKRDMAKRIRQGETLTGDGYMDALQNLFRQGGQKE